ncbi:MAG TPA: pilus assembly protein TadG-related protein [Aestuariivirga sp.]|nr:pilus assembly protein TadG-related protein [Aestuariivirga sp.]
MKTLSSFLLRDIKGNIAIATALMLPLLAGGAGFGVETAYWYHKDLELQQAADKAAYTAALEKRSGSNASTILNTATEVATANGYEPGTLAVHYPPIAGAYAGNTKAIEVNISIELPRYFTAMFLDDNITENVRAVAIMQTAANACVLALSTTAPAAALFSGSSDLNLVGCTVMSNSFTPDSVKVQGSAKLKTDCIIAVGDVSLTSGAQVTVCPAPITQAPPVADPFAEVPVPAGSGPTYTSTSGSVLQPGNYTSGMTLTGTKTLKPGVYVVSGGNFKINANANISGSGVTIYLKAGTSVSINGTATVNLSAPTSGTYSGMLFFGDRSATADVTLNGTAASKFTGAIYFANQDIKYLGNFSGESGCTQVVGKTVEWTGNTTINQDCTAYGMGSITGLQLVKLVE